jgi:nicotinamide mononucleotide (NMN) deamidase PncC
MMVSCLDLVRVTRSHAGWHVRQRLGVVLTGTVGGKGGNTDVQACTCCLWEDGREDLLDSERTRVGHSWCVQSREHVEGCKQQQKLSISITSNVLIIIITCN